MTLHTRAATDDILDIFNQPLRNLGPIGAQAESAGESDSDDDDDYTSAGESTGTGRISGTSEFGDDVTDINHVGEAEETDIKSVSPWSDYTSSKHVPKLDETERENQERPDDHAEDDWVVLGDGARTEATDENHQEGFASSSPTPEQSRNRTKYIPLPPEDYEPPTRPYRDPAQASQNRLPFMTPIVEKTESSLGASTVRGEKDYFNTKTPSRRHGNGSLVIPELNDELLSSPFEEVVNEAAVERRKIDASIVGLKKAKTASASKPVEVTGRESKGPIIRDAQCNPVDDTIRNTILEKIHPPLSSYQGFSDYRPDCLNKGSEIRKFVKALNKVSKNASDKTTTNISIPPTLRFLSPHINLYTIKRELGKGAFAPVYLAEHNTQTGDENDDSLPNPRPTPLQCRPPLSAIKCEDPPTSWEFYIMATAHRRLGVTRATDSILKPYEMHLFADEGYLIEEYRDQGTLLDLVNTAKADPTGVLDEPVAMFFAVELLRTVEALHSKGLLHGDLKADNCLVRLSPTPDAEHWDASFRRDGTGGWAAKGLSLIDFGRGIDMHAFGQDVQFVADWKTSKADCAEMREMRPWTWQVDYWGVAGVLHSLLFGKYIEDVVEKNTHVSSGGDDGGMVGLAGLKRYKLKEGLKRYWQTEIWLGLFDVLLNPARWVEREEGARMPVTRTLRTCREGMEDWLEGNAERKGLKGSLRRLEERIKERRR